MQILQAVSASPVLHELTSSRTCMLTAHHSQCSTVTVCSTCISTSPLARQAFDSSSGMRGGGTPAVSASLQAMGRKTTSGAAQLAARAARQRQCRRRSPTQQDDSARPAPPHLLARRHHHWQHHHQPECLWLNVLQKLARRFFCCILLTAPPPPPPQTPPAGPIKGWAHWGGGGRAFADSRDPEFAGEGPKKKSR